MCARYAMPAIPSATAAKPPTSITVFVVVVGGATGATVTGDGAVVIAVGDVGADAGGRGGNVLVSVGAAFGSEL